MSDPDNLRFAQTMIEEIDSKVQDISDWEARFIQSIKEQIEERHFVSDKQMDIIQPIWMRCV